jgi:hypothetical protein
MEGRELTDRYRLEKILKSTPATTVMAAVEAASGRPVVIKLVHPRSAAGLDVARSRFAHWAATVRALSHPAFPAILEAGFDAEGSAFLVVERLPGRGFETAPPTPGRAAALLAGVGEALALLAKRGLAHGNLAADNLWLAPAPQGGEEVKLLGLGTAPFRGDDFGEAAIAGDKAALTALRERFAPADAVAAEAAEAAAAAAAETASLGGEPEEEVLSPVDEEALHAPPEPPAPVEPAAAAPEPPPPPVEPETAPGLPRALWGGLAAAAVIVLGVLAFLVLGRDEPPPARAAAPPAPAAPAPRDPRPEDLVLAGDGAHVREWAAAHFEARAEEGARAGDYAAALAALGTVESGWPERPGLAARVAAVRDQRDAEPVQQAFLETLPGFERRRKPDEGLAELARVEPTPHLAAAFAEARRRLETQLAALDREPPVVELREGYLLQYARGTVAELSFRARDDYGVERVRIFARPPGGSFRELPAERDSFGYTVAIGPDFHRNGTVGVYVVATDVSGHEGRLGSRERPLELRRTGDFERMVR